MEQIAELIGPLFQHQVTQFTLAFSLAAFVHAREVRKEIKTQMASVVNSINSVAKALKEDLDRMNKRLENVENRIDAIDGGKK